MKWYLKESVCTDRAGNETFLAEILNEDECTITSLECESEFGEEEVSKFRHEATMIALAPQLYEFAMSVSNPDFALNILDVVKMARDAMQLANFECVGE